MGLEEDARLELEAERATPSREELFATPARFSDVPFLAELQSLIEKHHVPTVGLYRESGRGTTMFGLGNPYSRYEIHGRGWVIEKLPSGEDIGDSVFAWTDDGRLFQQTFWLDQGSNDRGIATQDYINGHAHEVRDQGFLPMMHVRPDMLWVWDNRMKSAAKSVLSGCRVGVITI